MTFRFPVAGLSALLSAVTLQLNDSHEQQSRSSLPKSSRAVRVATSDARLVPKPPVPRSGVGTVTESTPTMIPEVAKQTPLPESLMTLLMDESNGDIPTFLPEGKFFAMRREEFSNHLMKEYLSVDTFESFLEELHASGFTRIETDQHGIEVFWHRLFSKGNWKGCEQLIAELNERNNQESPTVASDDIVPDNDESLNDHCVNRSNSTFKRRLSPAHAQRVDNETQLRTQKSRGCNGSSSRRASSEAGAIIDQTDPVRLLREASDEDYHNAARIIASERIIHHGQTLSCTVQQSVPLEEQAVVGTTRTIVTDAIESLLRDEDHTRQTFQKHERALSKSSLPGVVPISKQLFASKQTEAVNENGEQTNGGSSAIGQNKEKKERC